MELPGTVGRSPVTQKCDPPPNSTSFELKLYEGVLDVSAHEMLGGTAVSINFTRDYRVFPVFVENKSRSLSLFFRGTGFNAAPLVINMLC